jgi:thymidylate synthase
MIAHDLKLEVGDFIHTLGDAHIYSNHIDQVKLQLSREVKSLPKIIINPKVTNMFNLSFEDFTLVDYFPHPHIPGSVAV